MLSFWHFHFKYTLVLFFSFSVACFSDPVRGLDSFAAFEEMFIVAKKHQVDFVLLGEIDQE